jgi:transposase
MTFTCKDMDAALREQDPRALEAARGHAETCPECRDTLELWNEIEAAAPLLRREWSSPGLWPSIHQALAEESERRKVRRIGRSRLAWRLSLAAAAVLVVAVGGRLALHGPARPAAGRPDAAGRFLTERALRDVERSEAEYVASIDRLARLVEPRIERPTSPLVASYREKLRLLDAAIADCRAEVKKNRFNAHLRRELLAMYREKQSTLQQLMEGET